MPSALIRIPCTVQGAGFWTGDGAGEERGVVAVKEEIVVGRDDHALPVPGDRDLVGAGRHAAALAPVGVEEEELVFARDDEERAALREPDLGAADRGHRARAADAAGERERMGGGGLFEIDAVDAAPVARHHVTARRIDVDAANELALGRRAQEREIGGDRAVERPDALTRPEPRSMTMTCRLSLAKAA